MAFGKNASDIITILHFVLQNLITVAAKAGISLPLRDPFDVVVFVAQMAAPYDAIIYIVIFAICSSVLILILA